MCEKLLKDLTGDNKGKIILTIQLKLDSEGDKMIIIRFSDGEWLVIDENDFKYNGDNDIIHTLTEKEYQYIICELNYLRNGDGG